ncbi:uncharacterized protein LOC111671797 [Seriola lalandi dorsalis]|uniref:uncharacterized protein LOC111671797 n=1 Tax=Seriola lalandi dorsalis TaxID=1841481 RepID=UPI000C6F5C00|nr:uncharacterized protein LOC111671797 [Seriola lalandi dorsalis]
MICCILLLLTLTSCVCGTFVVNVTQSSYQAEENHNITLEWSFTAKTHTPSDSLIIFCQLITDLRASVLYHLHEGVESQDEQFSGRVQCDKDVLREGRIRLHVSRLRTEDSGLYECQVVTSDGRSSGKCHLKVSAAVDQPQPETPTVRPQPETWREIGLYVGLTVAAVSVILCPLLCCVLCHCLTKSADEKQRVDTASETSSLSKRSTIYDSNLSVPTSPS